MLVFDGGSYNETTEDRLWLLRAVQAEGPPQLSVARALVNCFCYRRSRRRMFTGTLTDHVRAYAQPINPRWLASGDLFQLSLQTKDEHEQADARQQAQVREVKHCRRLEFGAHVLDAVELALSTDFASDVTDYAAHYVDGTSKGMQPRSGAFPGINRLWTRAPGWAGYKASEAPRVA